MSDAQRLKKNTIAGSIGNVMEWYDFAVFGFLAPIISPLFFPSEDYLVGLIKTYGVFAIGYLMRPIGGMIFGYIGDRLGRKKALQLSIFLMCVPTVCVGLLPTHESAGAMAALLLIACRLVQGISVGGELVGSMSFISEIAPPKERGYYGSLTLFSAIGGVLVGSGVATILTNTLDQGAMQEYGWRIPFLAGIIIGVVGIWLRRNLDESPDFQKVKDAGALPQNPVIEVLKEMPKEIFQLSCMVLLFGTGFYMLFVWMPTYLTKIVDPPVEHALLVNTISMAFLISSFLIAGKLSDRFGRKTIIGTGTLLIGLFAYPLFVVLDQGSMMEALAAQLVFAFFLALIQGPMPATMVEMFPTKYRFSGIAIGYNITLAFFGGTAPMICTWMIAETNNIAAPAYYLMVLAVASGVALYFVKLREGEHLR